MKKVKFITLNGLNQEVYGKLVDDQGNELTRCGFWRTTNKVEAAQSAILVAELNINEIALEIV